ncbi:transposase zinc-binding domain-containing protein, partial [Caballeronia grimmiae]|uniref:transposase zinc-binding domain-containing protein n=1 Tax=Caballeronia grimmiae TaxID=1071679 RepID=UPI001669C042
MRRCCYGRGRQSRDGCNITLGCAKTEVSFNSCRDRHCPKCQASAAHRWLEARQA